MLAFVLWVITSYLVISNIMRTSVAVLCIVALQLQMGSGELAQKNIVFFHVDVVIVAIVIPNTIANKLCADDGIGSAV